MGHSSNKELFIIFPNLTCFFRKNPRFIHAHLVKCLVSIYDSSVSVHVFGNIYYYVVFFKSNSFSSWGCTAAPREFVSLAPRAGGHFFVRSNHRVAAAPVKFNPAVKIDDCAPLRIAGVGRGRADVSDKCSRPRRRALNRRRRLRTRRTRRTFAGHLGTTPVSSPPNFTRRWSPVEYRSTPPRRDVSGGAFRRRSSPVRRDTGPGVSGTPVGPRSPGRNARFSVLMRGNAGWVLTWRGEFSGADLARTLCQILFCTLEIGGEWVIKSGRKLYRELDTIDKVRGIAYSF